MFKLIFMLMMVFYFICPSLAIEVKLIGSVTLSQEKIYFGAVESFTTTEDGLYIFPDYKQSNFKIFNENGKFVRVWGRRGNGPMEFDSPRSCDYSAPYLACFDMGKMKVLVFKREEGLKFGKVFEFHHGPDKLDIKVVNDRVIFSGYTGVTQDNNYRAYALCSVDIKTGEKSYILPNEVKYGFDSVDAWESQKHKFLPLGASGYFDICGDYIYFVWEGNLKVIKINRKTKEYSVFGEKTKRYVKPKFTNALERAYSALSFEGVRKETHKMSFVTGVFADADFIGIVYCNWNEEKSVYITTLQLYSLDGKMLEEFELPKSDNYIEFLSKFIHYDEERNILHFLSITFDDKTSLDKYVINKYLITLNN